jgi:hypothetical protein
MDLAVHVLGFTPDERHFTDRNLIELTRRHRPWVFATRNNINEHKTGADFEWWIRDSRCFVGILAQAKRLNIAGAKYEGIDRKTQSGQPQPERLIETARQRAMLPLYVLYNGGVPQFPPGPCGGGKPLPARGTTVTSAHHMAALAMQASTASLPDVQARAIPWECLVGCPLARRSSLAAGIADVLVGYGLIDQAEYARSQVDLDSIDARVRRLFSLLDQQASADGPQRDTLNEMISIAAENAPAAATIILDARRIPETREVDPREPRTDRP